MIRECVEFGHMWRAKHTRYEGWQECATCGLRTDYVDLDDPRDDR